MLWLLAALSGAALTVLLCFPAGWLAAIVDSRSGGRLTLGDAQGTLWRGSAFLGGAASGRDAVTPLLPGRFAWRLSPLLLFGVLELRLENPQALSQPLTLSGSWTRWQLGAAALRLPAEGLAGLGAPLNTLAPSGTLELSWSTLQAALAHGALELEGRTTLTLTDMASRLSAIRPLGSYEVALDWHGQQAQMQLRSLKGPLLLDGGGAVEHGRLRFSGRAQAAAGYEENLANLLNLLGQRRTDTDKNIIALEFR